MTSAQVVETSVTNNSSFQNYSHPDDHNRRTTDTPGFKPFTMSSSICIQVQSESCQWGNNIATRWIILRLMLISYQFPVVEISSEIGARIRVRKRIMFLSLALISSWCTWVFPCACVCNLQYTWAYLTGVNQASIFAVLLSNLKFNRVLVDCLGNPQGFITCL